MRSLSVHTLQEHFPYAYLRCPISYVIPSLIPFECTAPRRASAWGLTLTNVNNIDLLIAMCTSFALKSYRQKSILLFWELWVNTLSLGSVENIMHRVMVRHCSSANLILVANCLSFSLKICVLVLKEWRVIAPGFVDLLSSLVVLF